MRLPLFPLATVLFPGMTLPLHIFEARYREMVARCLNRKEPFGVVLIQSGAEVGEGAEPYRIGTSATITHAEHLGDGRLTIETLGQERFHILALHHDEAYLTGTVEPFPLQEGTSPLAHDAAHALRPWLARYLQLFSRAAQTPLAEPRLPPAPAALAYLAAILIQIPMLEKQDLLAQAHAPDLLDAERRLYRREMSLMRALLTNPQSKHDALMSPN